MAKKKANPRPPNDRGQGRKSEFEEFYPSQLIEHMAGGYSYKSFAGKIRKSRQTLYNWESDHLEWAEAKEIGEVANLYYWEQQGIDGLHNQTIKDGDGMTVTKSINAAIWSLNMKNRHFWRDRVEVSEEEDRERPLKDLSDAELMKLRGNGK